MSNIETTGKLILDPRMRETLKEIKDKGIRIPPQKQTVNVDLQNYKFPEGNTILKIVDNQLNTVLLNPRLGDEYIKKVKGRIIYAYDESIDKYQCIEGTAFITAHSLVKLGTNDYIPLGYLTTYFYTRAKEITKNSKNLRYSDRIEVESQRDYVLDKIKLLETSVEDQSILLIDGPLIGGDVYTHMIHAMRNFEERNIIPIFFVKNSNSNLVVDNIDLLKGKYNSDLHWAHEILNKGERTNFFCYTDQVNDRNAKVFCYVRLFEGSPQRVEFFVDTYKNHLAEIDDFMNLIAYMAIVQGEVKNPQIRLIAIAEKYAREYIKLTDIKTLIKKLGLTPTINSERF